MELGSLEQKFVDECSRNPKFFIKRAVKIEEPHMGAVIPFDMWDVQIDLVDILHEYNALIINKSRQIGGSLTNLAYMLHYSLFNNKKNLFIMSTSLTGAMYLLERFRRMLMRLPEFMKPKIISNNKRYIELENETKIMAVIANEHAVKDLIKGQHVDYLYMDEMAFGRMIDIQKVLDCVLPEMLLLETYKIVISSSPNGFNYFYRLWVSALLNDNNFKPVAIPWWTVPGRDEKWKTDMISRIGEDRFLAEFVCKFIGNNILYPGQKNPRHMSFE